MLGVRESHDFLWGILQQFIPGLKQVRGPESSEKGSLYPIHFKNEAEEHNRENLAKVKYTPLPGWGKWALPASLSRSAFRPPPPRAGPCFVLGSGGDSAPGEILALH